MRSDTIKRGFDKTPHRSLLRATGLKDEDFDKPFIGVANSYNDLIPGHIHLNELTLQVKKGIRDAGGVPFEWGVPGVTIFPTSIGVLRLPVQAESSPKCQCQWSVRM